jgi:hypothetical protein
MRGAVDADEAIAAARCRGGDSDNEFLFSDDNDEDVDGCDARQKLNGDRHRPASAAVPAPEPDPDPTYFILAYETDRIGEGSRQFLRRPAPQDRHHGLVNLPMTKIELDQTRFRSRMDSFPALDPFARVLPHFVAQAVAAAQGLADSHAPVLPKLRSG